MHIKYMGLEISYNFLLCFESINLFIEKPKIRASVNLYSGNFGMNTLIALTIIWKGYGNCQSIAA